MITTDTGNTQSHYNLRQPVRKTKHQPVHTVTNYALILLKVLQDRNTGKGKDGYSKKELVREALGHIHPKFKNWWWSEGACSGMFAAFNHNGLLTFNQKTKKWVIGANLDEYIGYHFGPYAYIHLNGEHPFDEAVEHNVHAMQIWADKKKERELIKQVGREFFFQN